MRISASEAFVETLVAHGVTDIFGIVGSAYMDALDLFPAAGIRFVSVAHCHEPPRRLHRAERPGHHELRDRDRSGLLGALAGRGHHA